MSFNAASLQLMAAKGLSIDDVIEIAKAMESRTKGAERQARYRRNKKACDVTNDDVTRDVTLVPNEYISNPPSPPETKVSSGDSKARDKFPCPANVDPTDWEGLKANRKAKRAALSAGAHRQIVRKLDEWANAGWPPGPIVAAAVERGWTTVFETDEMRQTNGRQQRQPDSLRGARPDPSLDMWRQANSELEAERRDAAPDLRTRVALPSFGSG